MIRLCGAALGFFAFSVTIFLGMVAGNPIEVTILRAIGALLVFCCLGLTTGWVASRVLDEHAKARHREMFREESNDGSLPQEQAARPAAQ
jgi:hypothetical protein